MTTQKLITLESLYADATVNDHRWLHTNVFSPLFDRVVPVHIYFDEGATRPSSRQVQAANQLARLSEGMAHIKQQLYAHWDNYSDSSGFTCRDADHAFHNSEFICVDINSADTWGNVPCFMFSYDVAWDPEHGCGIFVVDGKLSHFADFDEWPVVE